MVHLGDRYEFGFKNDGFCVKNDGFCILNERICTKHDRSVVHLGDRDVPNALTFIDKYTQVARILAPIAQCIDGLDAVWANPKTHPYIASEFSSLEDAKIEILSDFFKHGFDGDGDDGAFFLLKNDNFVLKVMILYSRNDDFIMKGGSCIDGRLTRYQRDTHTQPRTIAHITKHLCGLQCLELVLED